MVMAARLCDYTKIHRLVQFKGMVWCFVCYITIKLLRIMSTQGDPTARAARLGHLLSWCPSSVSLGVSSELRQGPCQAGALRLPLL